MEFKDSKIAGDVIENEILKSIQKKYPTAYCTEHLGKFSDYDIYIPETSSGIEIKGDYKSAETGNIVVEVEMNNKLSALSVTKAMYWVFVDGYRLIYLRPIDIYRFIEQNNYQKVTFIGKGDNIEKKAYLLNHEELILYAYDIDSGKVEMINESSPMYYNSFKDKYILD